MSSEVKRIYVDTNVLINYCTGQTDDVIALRYIFTKRRKEILFTPYLAIVQTISKLQSDNKQYNKEGMFTRNNHEAAK